MRQPLERSHAALAQLHARHIGQHARVERRVELVQRLACAQQAVERIQSARRGSSTATTAAHLDGREALVLAQIVHTAHHGLDAQRQVRVGRGLARPLGRRR